MDSNQFSNTNEAAYTAPAQPLYTQQSASGEIYAKPEIKCPGKEITGMVFGINALVWGVLAIILAWFPFYGLIFGLSYGIVGIACAIVTFVLYNKVKEQATVITNKILRGRSLAKAGLIVSIISVVVAILFTVFWVIMLFVATGSSNEIVDSLRNEFAQEFSKQPQYYY